MSHAEAQRGRGRETGESGRVLEWGVYKLRGATKSFANATLKASRVLPRHIETLVLDSPFGAEGREFLTTEHTEAAFGGTRKKRREYLTQRRRGRREGLAV